MKTFKYTLLGTFVLVGGLFALCVLAALLEHIEKGLGGLAVALPFAILFGAIIGQLIRDAREED